MFGHANPGSGSVTSTRTRAPWRRRGVVAIPVLLAMSAMLALSGCPGAPVVLPINPGAGSVVPESGSVTPVIRFLEPTIDTELSQGDTVLITFTVTDPDSNAMYTIYLDPDTIADNGNEIEIDSGFEDNVPKTGRTLSVDTGSIATGSYIVYGIANDGVNAPVRYEASGKLLILQPGLIPQNRPPFVIATAPTSVVGVIQGDRVTIQWCARDVDDTANVLVLLDYDQDANNDIRFSTSADVSTLCDGDFPRQVNGAILLACDTENDCTSATSGNVSTLTLTINAAVIPPRADGQPYRVRVDVTDQRNRVVHSYAPGGILVAPIVNTALVDMKDIGTKLAGAEFVGFDAGGRLGHAFTRVPDVNGDNADEFVMVARFGRPFERGAVGSAYMPYGRFGSRFGGTISVNSIATTIDGVEFITEPSTATEGIASVSFIDDLDNDGRVELLFGQPRIQGFYDLQDDSPCDDTFCQFDLLPNPLELDTADTFMGAADQWEGINPDGGLCSNDGDLSVATPIMSGYVMYCPGENLVTLVDDDNDTATPPVVTPRNALINLDRLSQINVGNPGDPGAIFRGAWYDFDYSQVDWPYAIVPTTEFGTTVASMPPLSDGSDQGGVIPEYGFPSQWFVYADTGRYSGPTPDTRPELLFSGPMAEEERGHVVLVFGQDMTSWDPNEADYESQNTIPHYECPPGGNPRLLVYPIFRIIVGGAPGDHLGYAQAAGDFNLDGNQDILMGAPGADRDGLVDNGLLYILFGRVDLPNIDFGLYNPPRVEIHGVQLGEELGGMNKPVGDINGDSIPDIAFAEPKFDTNSLTDAGHVGVIFGGRQLTGENVFNVTQVATNQLPGVRFFGTQEGGLAGSQIASAGDFNSDGFGDLLIVAPNETRAINGQVRRGVLYLVFGGFHLRNQLFQLSQVGTVDLPGIVFVSPFAVGTADEAAIESAEAAGDVDGDGFGDILIGVPGADFVNPAAPSQRRIDAGAAYLVYGTNAIELIGQ